jgi:hypothetical protein
MRTPFVAAVWFICMMGAATAQGPAGDTVPREIGNRSHGFDFQPTPSEVVPRETLAGVRPSKAQEDATDQDLQALDQSLLRNEGLNRNVPVFSPGK